jgi:hypothetical protein
VKACIIIPCFNHSATVAQVAQAALNYCPVFVVDDGSTAPLPELRGCTVIRLPENRGKGAALREGFAAAAAGGFTNAIVMDADGQHDAKYLPEFLKAAEAQPDALIVGVRDFIASGTPPGRRRSNAVSTFWFRIETGVPLGDSQCGFRGYPIPLTQRLKVHSQRYAYELEFMVRAAWVGTPIVPVPMVCAYRPEQLLQSHFRPIVDLMRITVMNIGLVLQSWTIPRPVRVAWSYGEHPPIRRTLHEFFSENAHEPGRLAFAVGLGLFCGIAPIWGYQMVAAGTLAHMLRLNKATALLASNISIPPIAPFILYGGLALGHWLFTGEALSFTAHQITRARLLEYVWQWCAGSVALGLAVGLVGTVMTYAFARVLRRR